MKTPATLAPEALDFAQLIHDGDTVFWAQATAEPVFLTRLLDAQAPRCPPFRLFFALTFAGDFAADHPNVTVSALGGGGAGRRFFAHDAGGVIPANISGLSRLISEGHPRVDVVLLQVSGPDRAGNYNAGLGIECLREAIAGARLVIAQLNPALPWTSGDTLIDGGLINILVPATHPPLELPARSIGPVERAIAAHVATLIPDRATLELGIGLIPEAVTAALGQKHGLGIHSGAIGDGVADLMQSGVVTNRHKEIDVGLTVTLMLMGTRRLYSFADRNPRIEIRPPRYTHDALVLGQFRRFVAINSALEIDLTGQVNAETLAGHSVGLTGGQMDFVRAATRAPEGRSIIALPSTSRDRAHSRIVARLADGVVTTPRADADCVVTEHGIAELKGRTLAERAGALIAVADPAFRPGLERASERLV
ncbi:MAG TPA: acetyl-CoA hydrolase/transferase C-terminal domain-containing protein [Stellaceae bacterium]|nr:acetyl-CoA hydrolase/transferase C-terminal domain-containing protein [Stellaceae bacterium]